MAAAQGQIPSATQATGGPHGSPPKTEIGRPECAEKGSHKDLHGLHETQRLGQGHQSRKPAEVLKRRDALERLTRQGTGSSALTSGPSSGRVARMLLGPWEPAAALPGFRCAPITRRGMGVSADTGRRQRRPLAWVNRKAGTELRYHLLWGDDSVARCCRSGQARRRRTLRRLLQ
uniref:Zinc finger protein 597 isoform X4 n=1 Tax=Camelus bactrianus TaxID=9837 RepID=A0A9W3HF13_CAMBA|nr:zinc finger protein 597 isoform X4 [Camelus bactrianus]